MPKVLLFNKPYGVISQFRAHDTHHSLSEFVHDKTLRLAGRLDTDSEGLLLLTDSGKLVHTISHPSAVKSKCYLIQVEGVAGPEHVHALEAGVQLKDGLSKAHSAALLDHPMLWLREPPVRFRKNKPTSWLKITLTEGKNRQVRRMSAAVGLPTLRLVRTHIGPFSLQNLLPGQSVELKPTPKWLKANGLL